MCVFSMIGDYYRPGSPWRPTEFPGWPTTPIAPRAPPVPVKDWDEARKAKLRELLRIAKELDAMNNEAECESPAKTDWMNDILKDR